jgi:hypothetical protein
MKTTSSITRKFITSSSLAIVFLLGSTLVLTTGCERENEDVGAYEAIGFPEGERTEGLEDGTVSGITTDNQISPITGDAVRGNEIQRLPRDEKGIVGSPFASDIKPIEREPVEQK